MSVLLDRNDVPQVSPEYVHLPMQHMINAGRGLVLLRGISEPELRDVERAVWDDIEGSSSLKVATLLRFRALIGVFAASKLQELFLRRGLALMPAALEVAAEMRLNVQWGFNPMKFARALEARFAEAGRLSSARRIDRTAVLQAASA